MHLFKFFFVGFFLVSGDNTSVGGDAYNGIKNACLRAGWFDGKNDS